ncbi:MAG: imidazolonepropionase [Planctomycetaceae bacterium]|nr:imidazolonepropionase [Planctomycetaceae bacterium]
MSLYFFLLVSTVTAAPEIPGEAVKQPMAIVGGTIHTVSGKTIENGTLLVRNGKIVAVGKKVKVPAKAITIDANGKSVYPGLFDAYTDIGLVEINAVRATRDQSEVGQINPSVKSWVSVNPDSEIIPVTRSNGVLLALTAPAGGLISGKSGVIQLDGWTFEDLTMKQGVGMHVDWPNMSPVIDWESDKSAKDQMEARDKALQTLRRAFDDARAYQKAQTVQDSAHARDARWEAMLPVLDRSLPLIVEAEDMQQIQAAVAFAEQQNAKLIIYGGYDAPLCSELLKKHDVPVIIGGVYRLPRRRSDHYDTPFTVPARLHEAGIKFCISGSGRFGASAVRNLPYHAAMAAAFGLPQEEALKSITLYPAEILGVANRVGSLKKGKDATFFITDGDPLETPTQVEAAYIQGREIDLSDRHKRLWNKYKEKYRRQRERD